MGIAGGVGGQFGKNAGRQGGLTGLEKGLADLIPGPLVEMAGRQIIIKHPPNLVGAFLLKEKLEQNLAGEVAAASAVPFRRQFLFQRGSCAGGPREFQAQKEKRRHQIGVTAGDLFEAGQFSPPEVFGNVATGKELAACRKTVFARLGLAVEILDQFFPFLADRRGGRTRRRGAVEFMEPCDSPRVRLGAFGQFFQERPGFPLAAQARIQFGQWQGETAVRRRKCRRIFLQQCQRFAEFSQPAQNLDALENQPTVRGFVPGRPLQQGQGTRGVALFLPQAREPHGGALKDGGARTGILPGQQSFQKCHGGFPHGRDAGKIDNPGANRLVAGGPPAESLQDGRSGFKPAGLLEAVGRLQEFLVRRTAGQPFPEQIRGAAGRGCGQLAQEELALGRAPEVFPAHGEEGGIAGEVLPVKRAGQAVEVPLLKLLAALLDEFRPPLAFGNSQAGKERRDFFRCGLVILLEPGEEGAGGARAAGVFLILPTGGQALLERGTLIGRRQQPTGADGAE